jgi:hypothetical protein
MKIKELIEELQKCNPDAQVKVEVRRYGETIAEVKKGNPESCAVDVVIVLL